MYDLYLARHIGVIAQNVQELFPELVSTNQATGRLSVAYSNLAVVAIQAIKEQQQQLQQQQATIEKQQQQIDELIKITNLLQQQFQPVKS